MFELYKDKTGEFRFHLKGKNEEIILTSEAYIQKATCENTIESVRRNSQDENKYDFKKSANDEWFFNLKATNGLIIGRSEMFDSEFNAQKGVNIVKMNAEEAEVTEIEINND